MKFEVRERDRRALFLLIGAVIVYVVSSFVLLPVYDGLKQGSSSVTDREQQLSKYRRALIRKGHYTELLDQVRKNLSADEGRFVRGDNPTLAAVELQTIVEAAAKKNGLDLSQRNISAARKRDDFFNEIAMTLSFEATPGQVAAFLADIRNAPKFVVARNVQVAPIDVLQERPQKGNFKKMVRANFTIAAPLPMAIKR